MGQLGRQLEELLYDCPHVQIMLGGSQSCSVERERPYEVSHSDRRNVWFALCGVTGGSVYRPLSPTVNRQKLQLNSTSVLSSDSSNVTDNPKRVINYV